MRAVAAVCAGILLAVSVPARADDAVDELRRDATVAAAFGVREGLGEADSTEHVWGRGELDFGERLRWGTGRLMPSYGSISPSLSLVAAATETTYVVLRSRLSVAAPAGVDGNHFIDAQFGSAPMRAKSYGGDIRVSYAFDHATDPGPARGAVEVGRGAFVDHGGEVTLRPRTGVSDRIAFGFPMSYVHRGVYWSDSTAPASPDKSANGIGGFQTNGARVGFDMSGGDETVGCIRCIFLGGGWSTTAFASRAGQTAPAIDRLELSFFNLDLVAPLNPTRTRAFEFQFTPSVVWLYSEGDKPQGKPYFAGRMSVSRYTRDAGGVSVAAVADPTWTPDGRRFVHHYRLIASAWAERLWGSPLGGVLSGAVDRSQAIGAKDSSYHTRASGDLEAFFRLAPGTRLGAAYEIQRGPRDSDPYDGKWQVGHSVTAFARIGESF